MKFAFLVTLFALTSLTASAQHHDSHNRAQEHWGYDCYQYTLNYMKTGMTDQWRTRFKNACLTIKNQYAYACVLKILSSFKGQGLSVWDDYYIACGTIHSQVGLDCVNDLFRRYSRCQWDKEIKDCSLWR